MFARIVSTFSLFLLLTTLGAAEGFRNLSTRLRGASTAETIAQLTASPVAKGDQEIGFALAGALAEKGKDRDAAAAKLRAMIELRAMQEPDADGPSPTQVAKEVKASPLYRDAGIDEESNWLGRALGRLSNLKWRPETPDIPQGPSFTLFGPWLINLVYLLLGVAVVTLAYIALRHVNWRRTLTRKAKALLEDDEPERTVDEWLAQADELAAAGRHREAVRALYLACLLRFDEYRVARFIRGETNWEHLKRIEESDRRPAHLDFRPATRAFDTIWYGRRVDGQADVDRFRGWYGDILSALRQGKAA